MPMWQFILFFLAIVLILPYTLSMFFDTEDLIPIVISILAVFISLAAVFKEKFSRENLRYYMAI